MVGGGYAKSGTREGEEAAPKTAHEAGVSVRDDGTWNSMMFEDGVEEDLGQGGSIHGSRGGCKVHKLGQAVGESNDGVETTRCAWELSDEVHGDFFPTCLRDRDGLQETSGSLVGRLVALADGAGRHVVTYTLGQVWPKVEASKELVCLVSSMVAGYVGIVVLMEKTFVNLGVVGYA